MPSPSLRVSLGNDPGIPASGIRGSAGIIPGWSALS